MLLSLYLQSEPSREPHSDNRHRDVVAYRDAARTVFAGRWPWWQSNKPRKNCKTVMLNCYRWNAVWQ